MAHPKYFWRGDTCLQIILLMEAILHHLGYINLANNGINYLSTGAGFLPSTVVITIACKDPTGFQGASISEITYVYTHQLEIALGTIT